MNIDKPTIIDYTLANHIHTSIISGGTIPYVSTTRQIVSNSGTGSISGGGDLSADRTLVLIGDSITPGNSMLYGTNASGVKGWYVQPSGGTSSSITGINGQVQFYSGTTISGDTSFTWDNANKVLNVGGTGTKLVVSGNTSTNNLIEGYATTVTAAGTTILTVTSSNQQYFSGTGLTQTVQMPVTSSLTLGHRYKIANNSTGTLTINSSGGNFIGAIPAGKSSLLTCISTSVTTAAGWFYEWASASNALETMPIATMSLTSISSGSNQATAWGFTGTIICPTNNIQVSTSTVIRSICTQTATGNYIFACYKYVAGGPYTLMFYGPLTAMPAASYFSATVSSVTDGTLVSGTYYYLGYFTSSNGATLAGCAITNNFNTLKPWRSIQVANNGTWNAITVAPSTIAEPGVEFTGGMPYFRIQN